jgi:hypothetical protein
MPSHLTYLLLALLALSASALQNFIIEEIPEEEKEYDDNLLFNHDHHCWETVDGSKLTQLPPDVFPRNICPQLRVISGLTVQQRLTAVERMVEVLFTLFIFFLLGKFINKCTGFKRH